MPPATTTPKPCWNAMSPTWPVISAALRRNCCTPSTARKSGRLYEHGELHPEVQLSGRFAHSNKPVDLNSVMREIDDARAEEAARQLRMQEAE